MKILRYIGSHKIVSAVVVAGLIGTTAGAVVINQASMPVEKEKVSANTTTVDTKTNKEPEETAKTETIEKKSAEPQVAPTTTTPSPETTEPVVVEPTVLSTQAYAEKYLNLSGQGQYCFDAIVKRWPERFSESVRENNVKALGIYSSPCSTGILQAESGNYNGVIFQYGNNGGRDGAFFDSDLAKSQH